MSSLIIVLILLVLTVERKCIHGLNVDYGVVDRERMELNAMVSAVARMVVPVIVSLDNANVLMEYRETFARTGVRQVSNFQTIFAKSTFK